MTCRLIEELLEESKHDQQIENALRMIKNGKLSYEEIAECSGLSLDEVKELALGRTA